METISEDYRRQNAQLHRQRSDYGTSSQRWLIYTAQLAKQLEAKTILDYGAGKGLLKQGIGKHFPIAEYDPAIPEMAADPEPADLVVCTDVMEHIEPEYLSRVLQHIAELSTKAAFLTIATRPAKKLLPDGRNAHLIVRPSVWWIEVLSRTFDIQRSVAGRGELLIVVKPKTETLEKAA